MSLTRRTFLGSIAVAASALAAGRAFARGAGPAPGVQLYTLRSELQRDVEGTLAAVAAVGYREVEFAGYHGRPASALAETLRTCGLAAPSAHVGLAELRERSAAVFDDARTLGHRWLTVPFLGAQERASRAAWREVVRQLNEHGAAARDVGLRIAYHNHDFEFASIDGATLFETLLGETDPALVDFQLDVYWAFRAGHDPLALLAAHPGRFTMLHLKDSQGPPQHVMSDVGGGIIDFDAILRRAPALGVRHAFVEHDRPADALASIRNSFSHLAALQH